MAIKKIAELDTIGVKNLVPFDVFAAKLASDDVVADRFRLVTSALREAQAKANGGKKIAPKAEDFLYAHAIMMHAAEASLIDQETGEPLKNAKGENAKGWFEKVSDSRGRESVRWTSPDGIKPYKNANRDIFPEEDLVAKYKEWIGKPLCRDHVSNTVDGVRGIVVDTFYDPKFKRVHALFALDKKNYPDLARKVEAGYATCVSMGTAVGKAICTECANVATVEAEYCIHAQTKSAYGEVNKDLSPIELSIVVTGADPRAKIKTVLASLNNYIERKENQLAKLAEDMKMDPSAGVKADLDTIGKELDSAKQGAATLGEDLQSLDDQTLEDLAKQMRRLNIDGHKEVVDVLIERALKEKSVGKDKVAKLLALLDAGDTARIDRVKGLLSGMDAVNPKGPENRESVSLQDSAGNPLNDNLGGPQDDLHTGDMLPTDNSGAAPAPLAAFMSFYQTGLEKVSGHKTLDRSEQAKTATSGISNNGGRANAVATLKEQPMNFAEMKERSMRRRTAYHQGTDDTTKYPPMGDSDKIRNTQDKQMDGDEVNTKVENPDLKVKELHQRASLDERRARRAALVEQAKTAAAGDVKTYKQDGKDVKTITGPDGKEKVLSQAAEDGKEEKKNEKRAYWQGTEEPTPGKRRYAPMGDSDRIRSTLDKHMSGQGMEPGDDGLHPGYSGKSDESVKKYWHRMASLKATRALGDNIKQAKWDIFADGKKVLTVKAAEAYPGLLGAKVAEDNSGSYKNYGEFFISKEYGESLLKLVREAAGPEGAAQALELPSAAGDAGAGPAPEAGGDLEAARDKVLEALSTIEDAVEDVRSTLGVDGLKDVNVDAAPESEAGAPAAAAPALASADAGLIQVFAAMSDVADELTQLEGQLDDGNSDALATVAEALADAEVIVAAAHEQIEVLAAKKSKKDEKNKKDDKMKGKEKEKSKEKMKEKDDKADKKKDSKDSKKDKDDKAKDKSKAKKSASDLLQEMIQARAAHREQLVAQAMGGPEDLGDLPPLDGDPTVPDGAPVDESDSGAQDELDKLLSDLEGGDAGAGAEGAAYDMAVDDPGMCADDGQAALDKEEKAEAKEIADKEVGKHEANPKMHDHDESKEKKAARKAWREAVAAKATIDLNSTYSDARKGSGEEVKFDANVSGDLALVENLATQHSKILEIAESQPRNVRMAAETINGLILKGAFTASDLDELVAKGAVDGEAAKYWKQFYGQVDGGRDFAAGLVKEYQQAKKASVADTEAREFRMRRAYALGLEAQDRGIITKSRAELEKYVDSMMHLPDNVFEHMKNVVAQHKPASKVATAAVQVGVNYDTEDSSEQVRVGAPSFDDLARLFGG